MSKREAFEKIRRSLPNKRHWAFAFRWTICAWTATYSTFRSTWPIKLSARSVWHCKQNDRRHFNTRFLLNPCKFRLPAAFELLDKVKYDKQILLVVVPKTCNAVPF